MSGKVGRSENVEVRRGGRVDVLRGYLIYFQSNSLSASEGEGAFYSVQSDLI